MKWTIPVVILPLLLWGCGETNPPSIAQQAPVALEQPALNESQRLRQWLDARYEEELQFSPLMLTRLGRKEGYGEIDDMSEEAELRQEQWLANTVAELNASFDYSALDDEGQLAWDLWVNKLSSAERMAPFRRHAYQFNQMRGPQSQLPTLLANNHRVDTEQDMRDYISRVSGIGRAVTQLLERAKLSAALGIRPPRFAYEGVIAETEKLIDGEPITASGTPVALWTDGSAKISALTEAGTITEQQAQALRDALREVLLEQFAPAYRDLIAFMTADSANASDEPQGVSALPDGAAYYDAAIHNLTTLDLDAGQIHAAGLSEVERLRSEMIAIKDAVGFDGSLQAFFEFTRTDPRFFFPNTDAGRQSYIDQSTAFFDLMRAELPNYFGLIPKADLVVKRVEPFREQDGAAQHYFAGTPDGSRPGIYYAHLSDMNAMPIPTMEAIAYHEGIPGHHMQISIAQELTGVPEFQKQYWSGSYMEGWALYAETLAKEMGGYKDPYSDFGRLTSEMWRAIRLVVDTGLHAKGWSEEQARQFFRDNSPISEGQIISEVRRYLVWPAQATTYKTGAMKILDLRERARSQIGDRFDIRAFHDLVLGRGAMPLSILERRVDRWIAQQTTETK